MKKLARGEKGYVLIAALLVLLLLGLVSGPVLSYMVSGLRAGHVFETKAAELYAADAGVEDALWHIVKGNVGVSCNDSNRRLPNITANNRSVSVNVTWVNNTTKDATWKITSIATTNSHSRTTVESYLDVRLVFRDLFNNAVTSLGGVIIKPGSTVNGTVQFGVPPDNKGTINGALIHESYQKWPEFDNLSTGYWNQVKNLTANTANTITIPGGTTPSSPHVIGPLRSEPQAGKLTIEDKGYVKLGGTIYVKGNLRIKSSGPGITIDLNQKTIFVEGDVTIDTGNTLSGSGCIIAKGDIYFYPNMQSDPNDFVFIMSIEKKVRFQPAHGTFYGSVAGDVDVELWGDTKLVWRPLGGEVNLDFPIEQYQYATNKASTATIRTWEVKPP